MSDWIFAGLKPFAWLRPTTKTSASQGSGVLIIQPLQQVLQDLPNQRIRSSKLEERLIQCIGQDCYRQTGDYRAFAETIGVLIALGELKAVNPRDFNGVVPSLPLPRMLQRLT